MEKITDPDERIRKRFQIKKLEEEGKEVDGRIEELRRLRGPEQ